MSDEKAPFGYTKAGKPRKRAARTGVGPGGKKGEGRPTKYEDWMDAAAIEVMKEGAHRWEIAERIGIPISTLEDWLSPTSPRHIQKFAKAVKEGDKLAEIWWLKLGKTAATGKVQNFSSAAWIFSMKNKFKWTDKQELSGNVPFTFNVTMHKDEDEEDA